ncbi:glutathione S-transferase, theta class-like [Acyrthosiphon pisum]|nr:glutathione S-transferase, theta class-like [Acyrthosiphon pisum]BAH70833.1 ACYPI009122 [Acyrthosiphon pisum]|eukprot:NP_001156289.1 glutathione S-transferase, theta class-like [Acyrthosiphon pisum]
MAKLIYYHNLLSQPSRALYMFFKKAEVPFEGKVVDLLKGEQFTAEFEAINPFKKVPVVNANGFVLIESIAILRYICRTYNVADHWYPKDSVKQAQVDEYLEWQHTNTRADCALYYLHKVLWPVMNGKPVNEQRVAQLEKKMITTLDLIENVWLKNKTFLSGNEISISDIIAICEIDQTRIAGYNPYANRPNLSNWKMRTATYLSPYYEEANEILEMHVAKYNKKYGKLNSHI